MNQDQILDRTLIINLDEKRKTFNTKGRSGFTIKATSVESKIKDIDFDKYDIIIVCTQNSLSGNSKHFQQKFMDIITKENKFKMLSKVDATRQVNRRSPLGLKRSNVRTRIYINEKNVKTHFETNKFQYSYAIKENNGRHAYTNKRSNSKKENIILGNNKSIINLTGLSIFRKTKDQREGIIYVALKFEYPGTFKNNKFYVIVKNMPNNFKENNINFEQNLLQNIKTSQSTSTKFIVNSKNKNLKFNNSYSTNKIEIMNLNNSFNQDTNNFVPPNTEVLVEDEQQNQELSSSSKKLSFMNRFRKVKPEVKLVNNENNDNEKPLIQKNNNKKNTNSQFKSSLIQLQEIVGKIYGGLYPIVYNKFTKSKINQLNNQEISKEEKKLIDLLLITICIYVILKKIKSINNKQDFIIKNFMYVTESFNNMKKEILEFNINSKNNTIKNDFLITLKNIVQLDVAEFDDMDSIIENLYKYEYGLLSSNKRKNTLKNILKNYKQYLIDINSINNNNKLAKYKVTSELKNKLKDNLLKILNNMYKLYKEELGIGI